MHFDPPIVGTDPVQLRTLLGLDDRGCSGMLNGREDVRVADTVTPRGSRHTELHAPIVSYATEALSG